MTTHLDVLVVENCRRAADDAVVALEAAGHHVERCFPPDSPGYPCAALDSPGVCPIDKGVDVLLSVRDRIEPRPTRYEVGVSCAIRAGVPIAEQGAEALDPFEPWVTHRVGDDVVASVEIAADRGYDRLREDIAARLTNLVPRDHGEPAVRCRFERHGRRLRVHLHGPDVNERTEQAIAVRVLDAIWSFGRVHDQVDVHYHRPT